MTERNGTRPQLPLGLAKRGYSGVIHHLAAGDAGSALSATEFNGWLSLEPSRYKALALSMSCQLSR